MILNPDLILKTDIRSGFLASFCSSHYASAYEDLDLVCDKKRSPATMRSLEILLID